MKTLITDASYLNTLAIVRYLGKENIETFLLGNNKNLDISRYSKYCKGYYEVPDYENEKKYINFVLKILIKEKIDLFIPVSHLATLIAAKYKNKINKVSKVEVADYSKIKIAFNKKSTYELAEKNGVPYPKTFYPQNIEEIKKISKIVNYPSVIKWLFESDKKIFFIIKNKEELLNKYYEIYKRYKPPIGFLPMIQEFVPTDNNYVYCFSALYQNGKCKRIFMQKQIRNVPINGGTCACAESCYIPELKIYSLKLLDSLNWHGVAHLEFKFHKTERKFKLMEINPKFWFSTEIALKAGVNFPYLLCQIATGKELEYSEEYDRNLKFHFPFSRELQHVKERPISFFKVLLDTLNPKVKSNVWLSDIKPNLLEFIIFLSLVIFPKPIKLFIKTLLKLFKKNE